MTPDKKQKGRAAQAANQNVAVHLGPPCDSPRRRTTSQTPRPIRKTGQENSSSRPLKISSWPSRKRTPRAMRTMAPTGAPRRQKAGCQYAEGSGGTGCGAWDRRSFQAVAAHTAAATVPGKSADRAPDMRRGRYRVADSRYRGGWGVGRACGRARGSSAGCSLGAGIPGWPAGGWPE